MEKYDLSTITRDQLQLLLSTAKDKMTKYNRCCEEVETIEICITEEQKKCKNIKNAEAKYQFFFVAPILSCAFAFLLLYALDYAFDLGCFLVRQQTVVGFAKDFVAPTMIVLSIVIYVLYIVFTFRRNKSKKQKHQKIIKEYESQLPELKKNRASAFGKLYDTIEPYQFPSDYCSEYAISQMLKFVENRQADNWKEVTALYEEHVHRLTMQQSARIGAEQAKLAAEYAREARNAADWAAAGAVYTALHK